MFMSFFGAGLANGATCSIGEVWTAKEADRNWSDIAMSSDGKIQASPERGSATGGGYIYISKDAGNSWEPKGPYLYWTSMDMSSDGKIQTALVYQGDIYVSADSGNTWTVAGMGKHDWMNNAMSADGTIQTAVDYKGKIYVSNDSGHVWTAVGSTQLWIGVAMSANGRYQTAVADDANIYVSDNYGYTWTAKETSRSWKGIAISSDGRIQTAVDYNGKIYVSTDYGNSWNAKDSDRQWWDLAMSSDGVIQTALELPGRIYVSIDSGNNWTARESSRRWSEVDMSADGKIQTAVEGSMGKIYVSSCDNSSPTTYSCTPPDPISPKTACPGTQTTGLSVATPWTDKGTLSACTTGGKCEYYTASSTPATCTLNFTPTPVNVGTKSNLAWNVSGNFTSAKIKCWGITNIDPTDVTSALIASPNSSIEWATTMAGKEKCELYFNNASAPTCTSNDLEIKSPATCTLKFDPTLVTVGGSSNFSWDVKGNFNSAWIVCDLGGTDPIDVTSTIKAQPKGTAAWTTTKTGNEMCHLTLDGKNYSYYKSLGYTNMCESNVLGVNPASSTTCGSQAGQTVNYGTLTATSLNLCSTGTTVNSFESWCGMYHWKCGTSTNWCNAYTQGKCGSVSGTTVTEALTKDSAGLCQDTKASYFQSTGSTYTWKCGKDGCGDERSETNGVVSCQATMGGGGDPTIKCSFNPNAIKVGESSTLSWESTGATKVTASSTGLYPMTETDMLTLTGSNLRTINEAGVMDFSFKAYGSTGKVASCPAKLTITAGTTFTCSPATPPTGKTACPNTQTTGFSEATPWTDKGTLSACTTGGKCEYYTAATCSGWSATLKATPSTGPATLTSNLTVNINVSFGGEKYDYTNQSCGAGGPTPTNVSGGDFTCVYPTAGTYAPSVKVTAQSTSCSSSASTTVTVTSASTLSCTGTLPSGSTMCADDNIGLTSSIAWQSVGASSTNCTTARKCEYYTPASGTNGTCGSSNGQSLASIPTTNLCTAGTPSAVTGTGPWTWTCAGIGGGTTANCSATKSSTPPTCTVSYSPTSITDSASSFSTFSWTSSDADRVTSQCSGLVSYEPIDVELNGSRKITYDDFKKFGTETCSMTPYKGGVVGTPCSATLTVSSAGTTYSCTGTLPTGSTKCEGDDNELTANLAWQSVGATASNCTTTRKCEYYTQATNCDLTANLYANPATGSAPLTAYINASINTSKGPIKCSNQDCNGGTISYPYADEKCIFNCTYTTAGTYNPKVHVTDTACAKDPTTKVVVNLVGTPDCNTKTCTGNSCWDGTKYIPGTKTESCATGSATASPNPAIAPGSAYLKWSSTNASGMEAACLSGPVIINRAGSFISDAECKTVGQCTDKGYELKFKENQTGTEICTFYPKNKSDSLPGTPFAVSFKVETPSTCGNNIVENQEECDYSPSSGQISYVPCPTSKTCKSCKCVSDTEAKCGNNTLDTGEDCDGASHACTTGKSCQGCKCVTGSATIDPEAPQRTEAVCEPDDPDCAAHTCKNIVCFDGCVKKQGTKNCPQGANLLSDQWVMFLCVLAIEC